MQYTLVILYKKKYICIYIKLYNGYFISNDFLCEYICMCIPLAILFNFKSYFFFWFFLNFRHSHGNLYIIK